VELVRASWWRWRHARGKELRAVVAGDDLELLVRRSSEGESAGRSCHVGDAVEHVECAALARRQRWRGLGRKEKPV